MCIRDRLCSILVEELSCKVYLLCSSFLSCSICRNLNYRVENLKHLTSSVQSGRLILLNCLLNFVVLCNLLTIYNFLDTLAIFVLLSNLSSYLDLVEVILLLNSKCDKVLSDLTNFLRSSLCCLCLLYTSRCV